MMRQTFCLTENFDLKKDHSKPCVSKNGLTAVGLRIEKNAS
jgi:hypothetical protein